jgi:hypothetical protein
MRKRKAPNIGEVADVLYRARDSDKFTRLLEPLTREEREKACRILTERIEADKARFRARRGGRR